MYFADTKITFQALHVTLKSFIHFYNVQKVLYFADTTMTFYMQSSNHSYISTMSEQYCTLQILHKLVPADFHLPSSPPCSYRFQHQHIPRNQVNLSSDEWIVSENIYSDYNISFKIIWTIRWTIFGFWPIYAAFKFDMFKAIRSTISYII